MAKKVLTAEEILKMPDDDYMNAQQLEFFRRRLTDLEKELRARSMHSNCARVTVNASC